MKRRVLIRHIERSGCELLREGGKHSVYVNRQENKVTTVQGTGKLTKILLNGYSRI